jgi:transcriptional regulator with GAF, ATPase, and Fis domain
MIIVMGSHMEIKSLKHKEEELLQEVLAKTHWDLMKTARLLKITLSQVKRKIKQHGLQEVDTSGDNT